MKMCARPSRAFKINSKASPMFRPPFGEKKLIEALGRQLCSIYKEQGNRIQYNQHRQNKHCFR